MPSDEAQPLNSDLQRASLEDLEPRSRLTDNSRHHSPSLVSTTHHRGNSDGEAPAPPPIDTPQQKHSQMRHQGGAPPCPSEHYEKDSVVQRLWLWEIFSTVVAALAFAAIVITLALRRDRPLPKWPSAITINALLAVFTAIFKACLLMPISECISQLKWLWYQKPRPLGCMEQWDLASRGGLFCCPFPAMNCMMNILMCRSVGIPAPDLYSQEPGPCYHWSHPYYGSNGS